MPCLHEEATLFFSIVVSQFVGKCCLSWLRLSNLSQFSRLRVGRPAIGLKFTGWDRNILVKLFSFERLDMHPFSARSVLRVILLWAIRTKQSLKLPWRSVSRYVKNSFSFFCIVFPYNRCWISRVNNVCESLFDPIRKAVGTNRGQDRLWRELKRLLSRLLKKFVRLWLVSNMRLLLHSLQNTGSLAAPSRAQVRVHPHSQWHSIFFLLMAVLADLELCWNQMEAYLNLLTRKLISGAKTSFSRVFVLRIKILLLLFY